MSKYFLERGVAFSPEYFSTNISMSLWNLLYLYLLYLLYETLYEYMYMYLHTHTHTHTHTHARRYTYIHKESNKHTFYRFLIEPRGSLQDDSFQHYHDPFLKNGLLAFSNLKENMN